MRLLQWPEPLAVVRLDPGADLPSWATSTALLSVTATPTETSLVCAADAVPSRATQHGPLTAFSVDGTLDLTLTGVLADLLAPLAEDEVAVFTLATYDTDWILVPAADADRAAGAWRRRGHEIVPAPSPVVEQS